MKTTEILNRLEERRQGDDAAREYDPVHMAAAVLLVNTAKYDGQVTDRERGTVIEGLRRNFAIPAVAANRLVERAERQIPNTHDSLYQAAEKLDNEMSQHERQALLGLVRDVVFSDGELAPIEMSLLASMGRLLGANQNNPKAARSTVMAALGMARHDVRRRHEDEKSVEEELELAARKRREQALEAANNATPGQKKAPEKKGPDLGAFFVKQAIKGLSRHTPS